MTSVGRLAFVAIASLTVSGVMAVLACGPAASVQQSAGGGTAVSENVSVPATEVPFVLQQSGEEGRDGEKRELTEPPTDEPTETPTATRYVPPTAHPSLCRDQHTMTYNAEENRIELGELTGRRCPPDGHPAVEKALRVRYNVSMEEIEALEAEGATGEFPVLPVIIYTSTVEAVDDVVTLLESSGGKSIQSGREPSVNAAGLVIAWVSIAAVPQLAEIDGVRSVGLQPEPSRPRPVREESLRVSSHLMNRYGFAYSNNAKRTARGDAEFYPVVRVSIILWGEDDVDNVLKFLKANGGEKITWRTVDDDPLVPAVIEADVSLGLMPDLQYVDGLRRVDEIQRTSGARPGSSDGNQGSGPRVVPTPTPVAITVAMQADQWHAAGFTGAGVAAGLSFRHGYLASPAGSKVVLYRYREFLDSVGFALEGQSEDFFEGYSRVVYFE